MNRRLLMLAPLGLVAAGGAGFYAMLRGMGAEPVQGEPPQA